MAGLKPVQLDRLQNWLLSSKLQASNNALYQLISQLIGILRDIETAVLDLTSSSNTTNTTTTINQTVNQISYGDSSGSDEIGFISATPSKPATIVNQIINQISLGDSSDSNEIGFISAQPSDFSSITIAQVATRVSIRL